MTNGGERVCNSFFRACELHATDPRRLLARLAVVAIVIIEYRVEILIGVPATDDWRLIRPPVAVMGRGEQITFRFDGEQPRQG